jgi:hypothetical protein
MGRQEKAKAGRISAAGGGGAFEDVHHGKRGGAAVVAFGEMAVPALIHHFDGAKLEQFRSDLFLLNFEGFRFARGLSDFLVGFDLDAAKIVFGFESVLSSSHFRFDGLVVFGGEVEVGDGDGVDDHVVRSEALLDEILDAVADGGAIGDELLGIVAGGGCFNRFENGGGDDAGFGVIIELRIDVGDVAGIDVIAEGDLSVDDLEVMGGGLLVGLDDLGLHVDSGDGFGNGEDKVRAGIEDASGDGAEAEDHAAIACVDGGEGRKEYEEGDGGDEIGNESFEAEAVLRAVSGVEGKRGEGAIESVDQEAEGEEEEDGVHG